MHKESRILIVTSRNLSNQSGEWRLISERSMALKKFDIETDIIYLRDGNIYKPEIFINNVILNIKIRSPLAYIFYFYKIFSRILNWLDKYPDGKILLSGFQMYPIVFLVPSNRILLDIHGTLDEWLELPPGSKRAVLLKSLYPIVTQLEKLSLDRSFGSLVVSTPLVKWAYENRAKNVWLFPCLPHIDPIIPIDSERQAIRKQLGYEELDIILVYSGGLSSWQCVEEGLLLFFSLKIILPQIKMLILTPVSPQAEKLRRDYQERGVQILSADPEDVASLLFSADIALMLRDSNATNYYAFPNKFAEYVYAGLGIISSPGLNDPAQIIDRYNLGLLIDPSEVRSGLTSDRTIEISELIVQLSSKQKHFERSEQAPKYVSSNTYAAKLAAGLRGRQ